jgi:hypothetical protein
MKRQATAWLVLPTVLLYAATSINFSGMQRWHDSDSVLVSFISLVRYVPFYWGENRCGQPGPLIASFIHDYRANLFAQTELVVLSSLGCVVLFNLLLLHRSRLRRKIRRPFLQQHGQLPQAIRELANFQVSK